MAKSKDYVPGNDDDLDGWSDNIVDTLPTYSSLFDMDDVDSAFPFNGTVAAGERETGLYGRFPATMKIKVQNTGAVDLEVGMELTADAVLSAPTTVPVGAAIEQDVTAWGGPGKPYFIVENALASDGSYVIFTSRLGRMLDAADSIVRELRATDDAKNNWQSQVEVKEATKEDKIALLRDEFQKMKRDTQNYTPAIGDDLEIIAPVDTIDENTAAPDLSAKKKPEGWGIYYNLRGHFDGIEIHRKRPADANFSFLKTKTTGKFYLDTDPMVSGTQYKAWFMIGDNRVGQESDILTISV